MSSKASANPLSFLYNHYPFYFLGSLAVLYGSLPTNARLAFWGAVLCLVCGIIISCIKAGWLQGSEHRLHIAFAELTRAIEKPTKTETTLKSS